MAPSRNIQGCNHPRLEAQVLLFILAFSCWLFCAAYGTSPMSTMDKYDNDTAHCEAFFKAYVNAAGSFTQCKLLHAKPFRICTKCVDQYAIMQDLYNDLTTDPQLHSCMVRYLKSDRVQIIPMTQKNANDLWDNADCISCMNNLHVDPKTKIVSYTVPKDVTNFMERFHNISDCLQNNSFHHFDIMEAQPQIRDGNISSLCSLCKESYLNLNDYYNSMADAADGNVCMDIVDMMNYTRVSWSDDLNCSHRGADATSVVIITVFVGLSPFFFYLPLRYTSKKSVNKVLKQKRLGTSYEGITSVSSSFAAGDSLSRNATPLPPIGSRLH